MKNTGPSSQRRHGFTMLEILLALALLGAVVVKVHGVMSLASRNTSQQTAEIVLEDQARRVLRQIGYAIMGSNRESLAPDAAAPMSTEDLRYQINLGIENGEVVWSDPEQVALETDDLQIYWSQNPGVAAERRVVWTSLVAPYLEGEIPNGMDDNGNGLIDERGLSFVVDGNSVRIRITLERARDGQEPLIRTVETTVTCRNLGDGA